MFIIKKLLFARNVAKGSLIEPVYLGMLGVIATPNHSVVNFVMSAFQDLRPVRIMRQPTPIRSCVKDVKNVSLVKMIKQIIIVKPNLVKKTVKKPITHVLHVN